MSKNKDIIKKKINSILIVNRGEIACRIIRTAKKLGIKSVAVYSDIDADALFVEKADVKLPLNGITGAETYLNNEKIIKAIKQSGADAVHPGYGFLSENADFVKQLEENNIGFIGPSSYSIEAMGDKLKAKQMAEKAGVAMVPGSTELIENTDQAIKEAKKIGYPVLLKAVAGGGGKGIRIVNNDDEMDEKLADVKYEAKTIYKNDAMLLEKYIEHPRHIEIQIASDKYGNVVCLGERECSIQRANQKVIEECPSTFVDKGMRKKMYASATALAKVCNYHSVGTMEFIVDARKNFYFLEMNTRLQVEHPVTEEVVRVKGKKLDLVELMIRIEEGDELGFSQKDVELLGSSIECRICAENPARGFMPSNGKITHYITPKESENVRIETGIRLGDDISPYYDSMIAKLIAYGRTRTDTIEVMKNALSQYEIDGIETNIALLENILRQSDFANGNISTWFIKEHYPNGFNALPLNDNVIKAFISTAVMLYLQDLKNNINSNYTGYIPRDLSISNLYVRIGDDKDYLIEIVDDNVSHFTIFYNDNRIQSDFKVVKKNIVQGILDNRSAYAVRILKEKGMTKTMQCSGITTDITIYKQDNYKYLQYMPPKPDESKPQFLCSPLTGKITKLKVEVGDVVNIGQHLVSIEAMKMDNVITSVCCAKVKNVFHQIGENVNNGDKLIEFDYNLEK